MYASQCHCAGHCERCATELSLDVQCDADKMSVTSRAVKSHSGVLPFHEDENDPGILIVKMRKGDRISMRMLAKKGTGRSHAKYSPCTAVSFAYTDDVFTLTVESSGSLHPASIVKTALTVLRQKLAGLKTELQKDFGFNQK